MVRWYYNVNFGIFEHDINANMDLTGLGPYNLVEQGEWLSLVARKTDVEIIINNPETNMPMLYTDEELVRKVTQEKLRARREEECFPYVNRGELWYEVFVDTPEKQAEFKKWYLDWLDVTETLVVPEKPSWL